MILLHCLGLSQHRITPAPCHPRLLRIRIIRKHTIQPIHPNRRIIPDRQHQHHPLQALAHGRHPAQRGKVVVVGERRLLLRAELVGNVADGVDARDGRHRVGHDLAALHVDPVDAAERAGVGAVGRVELRDDRDGLGRVDRLARAVKVLVAHAE